MLKKLLVLALIMLLSFSMIACDLEEVVEVEDGDQNEQNNDGTNDLKDPNREETPSTQDPPAEEKQPTRTEPAPEVKDFGGYAFKIRSDGIGTYEIVAPTELNGQGINDVTYRRNKTVEALYHVTIVEEVYPDKSGLDSITDLQRFEMSGDVYYADLHAIEAERMLGGAVGSSGYFYNLYDVDSLDLAKPWWDQAFLAATTIDGYAYGLVGDISTTDELAIQPLILNAGFLKSALPYVDVYQMLDTGNWTMERFWGLCQTFDTSVNGTTKDRYGLIYDSSLPMSLFAASGTKTFGGTYETLTLNFGIQSNLESTVVSLLQAIADGVALGDTTWISDTPSDQAPYTYASARQHFLEDGALMMTGTIEDALTRLGEKEDVYYLPYPKYDLEQEGYHSLVKNDFAIYAIPMSTPDAERTGLIAEALAYYSVEMTSAVEQLLLDRSFTDKNEALAILKITLGSKSYDMGALVEISPYHAEVFQMMQNGQLDSYDTAMTVWARQMINARGKGALQIFFKKYTTTG